MKKKKPTKYILFALYCAALVFLFFWQRQRNMGLPHWSMLHEAQNLVPLRTLERLIAMLKMHRPAVTKYALVNLIGALLMYLPLGAMLPWMFGAMRRSFVTLPICFILITIVEIAQLMTMRGFADIDDLLLNTVGAAAGYGIWRLSYAIGKRRSNMPNADR